MDNLRTTINLLFSHRKCEEIIHSLKHYSPNKRLESNVEMNWFQCCFREEANIYTLDQISSIQRILATTWMMPPPENGVLSKSGKSVFNVLLHFSKDLLIEQGKAPICRYEHLLKWHFLATQVGEDLLTTSFLAAKDLASRAKPRVQFSWPPIIGHDNRAINHILEKGLMDLHFHLKGSSYNFELNWMSLMNSIVGREREFKSLKNYQSVSLQLNDKSISDSLYLLTIKTCAIRYLLFQKLVGNLSNGYSAGEQTGNQTDELTELSPLVFAQTLAEAAMLMPKLERKLKTVGHMHGKRFGGAIVDYAISSNETCIENSDSELFLMKILSGERELMYRMFSEIYRGRVNFEFYSTLFYAYLAAKSRIRQELVQLNEKIGFGNFANYEGRKELFIRENSIYSTLIPHMAVNGFIKERSNNGLEARITPKSDGKSLAKAIKKSDKAVYDRRFQPKSDLPLLARLEKKTPARKDFQYILHFIKKEDKITVRRDLYSRQSKLLSGVEKEAKAIQSIRENYPKQAERVVAIDAANSEIFCRPESFAQAFRFLRNEAIPSKNEYIQGIQLPELSFTFHVGEDYMDLVDGLRSIEEAILFLNLRDGDRLGHALALGIDAERYYEMGNYTLIMQKQIFLDNVVWLWYKLQRVDSFEKAEVLHKCHEWYCQLFREIYQQQNGEYEQTPPIQTYYQAWLLRGDNPANYSMQLGSKEEKEFVKYSEDDYSTWQKQALNNLDSVRIARQNRCARKIYYRYHYDEQVKQLGEMCQQFKIDKGYINAVTEIQERMRKEIEKQHICIETNPSSNYVIGTIDRYSNHPIFKFYNLGIDVEHANSQIGVSINTDDQGIFSTSIEREFSLVALALEKKSEQQEGLQNTPRTIYRWIDDIREMAFEQRFK
ncbi:MAG: hypothetical protein ACRCZM_04795 [Bacteroidales bacterium]